MHGNLGINMDDVAYVAVLTAAVASIGIAMVAFLGEEVRRSEPTAQQCDRGLTISPALPRAG